MRRTPTARESKTMQKVPRVGDVMRRSFGVVGPDASLHQVAKLLIRRKTTGVAVVDAAGRFHGFLSTQGLMLALVDFLNEEVPVGPIGSYLDPEPPPLAEDSPLMAAVDAFAKRGRANLALPVLRGERLVGVVTRLDVVRATMGYFAGEKDTSPGTLYLSALRHSDEKPSFEE
jgi:CBS domain-containing protein